MATASGVHAKKRLKFGLQPRGKNSIDTSRHKMNIIDHNYIITHTTKLLQHPTTILGLVSEFVFQIGDYTT
jgi:hypothetical protein